ncbi:MAG: DUF1592 domain-containing protein [Gemmataceae bacterium]
MTLRLPFTLILLLPSAVRADDPFVDKVVPFLKDFCVGCHNAKKAAADLDLTKYGTAAKAIADFRQWEHVVGFLKREEMPPEKSKQPAAASRAEIVKLLDAMLLAEAKKTAGDPGPVQPRRLTNAEYDNTIRDLTGADVRAAKSFPIDPASGEGFNNTGEALTMSPSLFKSYFAAAELVSNHAMLTTQGLRFAPHQAATFADRQKYWESAIIDFYTKHDVDYEKYFTMLWLYKHRAEEKKDASVEQWAANAGLSPKYATLLWDTLTGTSEDAFALKGLRKSWAAIGPKDAGAVRALAGHVKTLSRELCTKEMNAIGADAGNGPVMHMEKRRQTAATRDTFDKNRFGAQRLTAGWNNPSDKASIKLTIRIDGAFDQKADGTVTFNGTFSTDRMTTSGKKQWPLLEVLREHAPDQLEKLTRAGGDRFSLKAPAAVELEIPTKAFGFKEKGRLNFTSDASLADSTAGAVVIRITDSPSIVLLDPKQAAAFEASAAAFCKVFPSRFVYVDPTRGISAGFHLIEGFFRDDQPLCRMVLSEAENRELNKLWEELYFVTGITEKMLRGFVFFERSERNFMKHTDFDPFREEDPFLTNDDVLARFEEVYLKRSNVKLTGEELAKHPITIFFTEIRNGLKQRAELLAKNEPLYLKDLLAFAQAAWRRPLTDAERAKIEAFYTLACRDKDHGVEAAVRSSLVRILVSPHFAMHFTAAPVGEGVAPLPDLALASRLSYFIWAGPPDAELLALAKANKLHEPETLRSQIRRMVKDPKVSRFALEFFGQWFGHRDFLTQESVNRMAFPAFDDALKAAMFEEPTRLIAHLIQNDKPILDLLNGDSTMVNAKLAKHYGLPFTGGSDDWQVVNGMRATGRGGVLGMAVFLTKNSQPQRTSPVKRGFWVVHKVLGEHIPPPPPDVAVLPAKESDTNGKTIRELLKLHVADEKCARCHVRFDPVGLAMEGFDPIGRTRTKDLAGRAIDNVVSLSNGKTSKGVPEFGDYLAKTRQADFTRTLCHKFLGYALGRSLQLSDQPLLNEMQAKLEKSEYKMSAIIELVATSPQFVNQRCRDFDPAKLRK